MEYRLADKDILMLPLRELTRHPEREAILLQRAFLEVDSTTWTDEQKERVKQTARDVVERYHKDDTRDDHTFATHVLRVANRIISRNHFNHCEDPNLIIASLLHDAVEDRPERLLDEQELAEIDIEGRIAQQERALAVITEKYGQEVADMVAAVSNEIYDKSQFSEQERQERYRDHVITLMESDSNARYIKLSDFIDNCLGLEYNPDVGKRAKLARKYKPLLPCMLRFVLGSDLSDTVKQDIEAELIYANTLCSKIIESKGQVQKLGSMIRTQLSVDEQISRLRSPKNAA